MGMGYNKGRCTAGHYPSSQVQISDDPGLHVTSQSLVRQGFYNLYPFSQKG
jgi:hypothetical protein